MKLEQKIEKLLKPYHDPKRAAHDLGYMNTLLDLHGCNLPAIRSVLKKIKSELNDLTLAKKRQLFNQVWNASSSFEVLYVALLYFDILRIQTDLDDWKTLKKWTNKIDNWAHSDVISGIFADLLERYPEEIYPQLQKWNGSKKSWQRRISLTSLMLYYRLRKKVLPANKILPLVRARLADEDPYVQKAVGWTLRECGQAYPSETAEFIRQHITQLSATAFSYATEKWSARAKRGLKEARKKARAKK